MSHPAPSDLELAALISSKICHDVIGPVGAIYNGLEILDEDNNLEAKTYAMDVIRNVTEQASAKLQFARFAFGAAGSAGSTIDLTTAEQISRGFIGNGKHKLTWKGAPGHMTKDLVKLLLNMILTAIGAIPRGGKITVKLDDLNTQPNFTITATGPMVRVPPKFLELHSGQKLADPIDAHSVQPYYTLLLARESGMEISIRASAEEVVFTVR